MNMVMISPGSYVAPLLSWANINLNWLFSVIAGFFDGLMFFGTSLFFLAPALVVIVFLSLLVAWTAGIGRGVLCLIGLTLCWMFNLWNETIATIVMVVIAVIFSIAVGIPIGVALSRRKWLEMIARPCLDVAQTLPPWVYLVPAVILFGLGAVPALLATIIYGIAPMIRLTLLAMSQVELQRIELGEAIGATRGQILRKIELPSALPTLLVGVNQCILLSLAMVVLAGLVGAGGLGAEVTRGLTRMDFGLGVRAGLSIVVLAIVMDRVLKGLVPQNYQSQTH